MTTEDLSIAKRKIFEGLLLIEPCVRVYLDISSPGVAVPEDCKKRPVGVLVLEYGLNMPNPIKDFVIDDAGILAKLTFNKIPHQTWIPWEAIFIVCNALDQGFVFQASVPKRMTEAKAARDAKAAPFALTSLPAADETEPSDLTSETLARGWLPKIIPGGMN